MSQSYLIILVFLFQTGIIDEANMFSQLVNSSNEGEILLKSILNWRVVNTKQENHFHAVLTSSDSFFFNWIINRIAM